MTDLTEILSQELIQLGSVATDKNGILKEITSLAKKSPVLCNESEQTIFKALTEREKVSSTGFGKGIAIPHCALEGIKDFVVGMLIVPDGVGFEALDGQKTKLFVFIIAPESRRNEHIHLLSSVSRVLNDANAVTEILSCKTPTTALEKFLDHTHAKPVPKKHTENCLIHVIIQEEEKFEDILQIFSEMEDCHVSVIEGNDMGSFLQAMPLFATFWNEKRKSFHRMIVAFTRKDLSNEIVRQINAIANGGGDATGVLVAVQELIHLSGSLSL